MKEKITLKVCHTCWEWLRSEFFPVGKRHCKSCVAQQRRNNPPPDYSKDWHANNPERYRISQQGSSAVWNAIKRGELVRPTRCEDCGLTCVPDAAHSNYTRPLDIRWLCRSCHTIWDHSEPKTKTN